jgi:L-2-hydroxyglutarate oxidase LhgO
LIATTDQQAERLVDIQRQAAENGVELDWRSSKAISEHLPETLVKNALWSLDKGIVDSHQLMLALLKDVECRGGHVVYNTRATRITADNNSHCVHATDSTDDYRLYGPLVVNSAGLGAVTLAHQSEGLPSNQIPKLHYAKGSYFSYSARHPFKSLGYPLPEEGGLGVHLTLDMAGGARFGPNVEWVEKLDVSIEERFKEDFYNATCSWWPTIKKESLNPAYAEIRPKLKGSNEGFFDFRVLGPEDHGCVSMVHLFGIEPPGLTASLAIADTVAGKLQL